MTPVGFVFGLHLHQPVGNFDSVFETHLDTVYRPLLSALDEGDCFPVTLHLSGPLLDWLARRAPDYLDLVGRYVSDGRIELLAAGYDEPILAVLPTPDRLEQIARMREELRRRFGADAVGLWLTERVWEPALAEDLAQAGIKYVIVDDRHFLATGFERSSLHTHYRTEHAGATVAVFPIDERLRYLVPFRPPSELASYFHELKVAGAPLAILADDGEKFGGWPGTQRWVYERGWMREFTAMLREQRANGTIKLLTFREALATVPSGGLAYLPSASYREMEGWALPEPAAARLTALERELGESRMSGPDGALVRGTHWRNFFVKYAESNRMHKKMLALSALSRQRGDPKDARRAIGRAQCNDAYWHGVFGGLYLPFLRDPIWAELARAEAVLRAGEPLEAEVHDLDCDGHDEIWVHSAAFSAHVSPTRGGAIEEWTLFAPAINVANTLTRRREQYHDRTEANHGGTGSDDQGTPSIHDIDSALALEDLPPPDDFTRAILQESIIDSEPNETDKLAGILDRARTWAAARLEHAIERSPDAVEITLQGEGLTKRLRFGPAGDVQVSFTWSPDASGNTAALFVTELSLAAPVRLGGDWSTQWSYPIETVAKSERGFDRTVQGHGMVVGWPAARGKGDLTISLAGDGRPDDSA